MSARAEKSSPATSLLLKFNGRVGADPLPKIRELAKKLGLVVEDLGVKAGMHTARVSGAPNTLTQFERALLRFPSVKAKLE